MATLTEVLPARKSSKHSAVRWEPIAGDAHAAGVLVIDTDRASVTYHVAEFPTDWAGRGFLFAKVTTGTDPQSESYSVFCGNHGAKLCECRGFERFRHCKHTDAAEALIANGWL